MTQTRLPDVPTLVHHLRRRAAEHPDRRAFTFLQDGERETAVLTYGELDRRARELGAQLQTSLDPTSRVLLLCPPDLESVVGFLGCLYAGVLPVPSYPPRARRRVGRMEALARDAQPRAVLTTREASEPLRRATAALDDLEKAAWFVTNTGDDKAPGVWTPPRVAPSELAFLQYTSGSTSDPKGVAVSHANLLHTLEAIRVLAKTTEETVIVSWLPLYHDMGLIASILHSVYVGAHSVQMSPVAFLQRPRRWLEAITRYRATASGGPDFGYALCHQRIRPEDGEGLDLSSWRIAFNSSEPLRPLVLKRFAEAFAGFGFRARAFLPCYGLAEATLLVAAAKPGRLPKTRVLSAEALERGCAEPGDGQDRRRELVCCGRPVLGTTLRVVDPETLSLMPEGRVGEIWVQGPSVCTGYWNRPAASAEVFGARLRTGKDHGDGGFLRTGDLGFLDGGELYVTGRLRDLVILRGRNHFPQDLEETTRSSHPALRAVAAFSVEVDEQERLVIVAELDRRTETPPETIATAVRCNLALEHEVQVLDIVFIRQGTLPKTSSGKIRRRATRAAYLSEELTVVDRSRLSYEKLHADTGLPTLPPGTLEALDETTRNELIQRVLRDQVANALQISPHALSDDRPLAAYGLSSLVAARLSADLETALGVPVGIADLYEAENLENLAARIESVLGTAPQTPKPELRAGLWTDPQRPLSFAEQRLWFIDQLMPGSSAYNIPAQLRLRGDLEVRTLQKALSEICRRHEPLRSIYSQSEGTPFSRALKPVLQPLPVIDLRLLERSDSEGEEVNLAARELRQPIDLATGPLLRTCLLRTASDDHLMLVTMHHIAADGWSVAIFLRELADLYEAFSEGRPSPLPELAVHYGDFVAWQRQMLAGEQLERAVIYWRQQLAGAPTLLELPLDRSRPSVPTSKAASRDLSAPSQLRIAIESLAVAEGTTLFVLSLAVFGVLLSRHSRTRDLVIGSPVAGRYRPEAEPLIGFFVNMLPLRLETPRHLSFREFIGSCRTRVLEALHHQILPFEKMVAELHLDMSLARSPLFQVSFALETPPFEHQQLDLAGLVLEPRRGPQRERAFDLQVSVLPIGDRLEIRFDYASDLFDGTTIERLARHYLRLLASATEAPDRRLSALPLLDAAERAQIALEWNDTATAFPSDRTVHGLLAEVTRRRPEATALVYGNQRLTYGGLERQSRALAQRLVMLGVGADRPFAFRLSPSLELIIAMVGTLQAGAPYLPIDPQQPLERQRFTLLDSGATALVAAEPPEPELCDGIPWFTPLEVEFQEASRPSMRLPGVGPDNLAYVLYTSGSTGRPKGVAVPHRAVCRLVRETDYLQIGPSDRCALLAPIAFDASTFEVWGALLNGATLFVAPEETRKSPRALAELIAEEHLTTLFLVTALFNLIAEKQTSAFTSLENLIIGGDIASAERIRNALGGGGPQRLINAYGPTESTTFATTHRCERWLGDGASPPIGRAISNTRAYVVDEALKLVPVGSPGELLLGGAGLARCYLHRPAQTAIAFVPDSLSGCAGERLYRTGDVVRQGADGTLQFQGRMDAQVKVRGFRIEPGEIEAALVQQEGVQQAVVLTREDRSGERQLVAYVVPEDPASDLSTDHLRTALARHVPPYMLPAAVVLLKALPLTASGKVDRRALPEPKEVRSVDYLPPRTPTEDALALIWQELLQINRIGVSESFFELGGHSLLATRVMARVREQFHVELPLRALFEAPTVAALAQSIKEARERPAVLRSLPRPPGASFPLSFAQMRLWYFEQLAPRTSVYHIPAAFRLRGPLDAASLRSALGEIVARHETLRTRFFPRAGSAMQEILPPEPAEHWPLPVIDLSSLRPSSRQDTAARLRQREASRPFDLEAGSLLRTLLLRRGGEDHEVCIVLHHLVADGWSTAIFLWELSTLYGFYGFGAVLQLEPVAIQVADFAVWQQEQFATRDLEDELNFWRQRLVPQEVILELPTDRPRPTQPTYRGGMWSFELSSTATTEFQKVCRREGSTSYMGFAALYLTLLARITGARDLRFGTPVAGRLQQELESPIGLFVQTLIVAVETDLSRTFREHLAQVRDSVLEVYAHQDLPIEKIAEDLSGSATTANLVQVLLALQQPEPSLELQGLQVERLPVSTATAKFDLSLFLTERREGGLGGEIEYSRDLFDATTVGRLAGYFAQLLRSATVAPEATLGSLALLSAAQEAQLTREWNEAPLPPPAERIESRAVAERWLHTPFIQQAIRNPSAVALTWRDQWFSYAELHKRSTRLATRLQSLGVGREELVGILLDREPHLIVSLLAVLQAGGAYVPLDTAYPPARLAALIEDSGSRVIFGRPDLIGAPTGAGLQTGQLGNETLWLDPEEWRSQPANLRPLEGTPEHLAYLLFTSGSTGRPRGVAVTHRSALALIDWAAEVWSPQERQCVLAATSISFDLSVYEIFFTLATGGRILLVDSILTLVTELARDGVTLVNTVPTSAAELLRQDALPAGLRAANLAGEVLSRSLVNEIFRRAPLGTRVCNLYGPTETTTYDTYAFVDRTDSGEPSIGRPISGSRAYVLDNQMRPVPPGVRGQLSLAGRGLARSYWGRPGSTADRFRPNPWAGTSDPPGSRLYFTGDLVRQGADGRLHFLGRADTQVKIRGFRIELGEIEAAIAALPEVSSAAVIAVSALDKTLGYRLVAFVVTRESESLSATQLRRHLASQLPDYFVPQAFTFLPAMPLTPNGKLDSQALAHMWLEEAREDDIAPLEPRTPVEEIVVAAFAEALDVPSVGIHSNFFALGGNSLLAIRIVQLLRRRGFPLSLMDFFQASEPAALARRITEGDLDGEALEFEPRTPGQAIPASFSQRRLWLLDSSLPDPTAYTLAGALRLLGPLRPRHLRDAIWRLTERHEVLRTRLETIGEQPFQVIDPTPASFELPIVDVRNLSTQDQNRAWQKLVLAGSRRRFDLSRGPLLRLILLRRLPDDHQLLAFFHHIVADARSVEIFREELTTLYSGFPEGTTNRLVPLDIGYAEFALRQHRWLHTPAYQKQLDYWLQQLESAPPLLELPVDRPRPRGLSSRGACRRIPIENSLIEDFGVLVHREKASLFIGLFAGFTALLHRYTRADDLVVGIPVTGRTHPSLEPLIGYFDNTLALRSRLDRRVSFRQFLKATRELALEAFAHSELPFDEVVSRLRPDREPSHPPVVQILFSVQHDPATSWTLGELEAQAMTLEPVTSRLDLSVALLRRQDALEAYAEFSSDLFDGSTIERLLRHLEALLLAATYRPDTQVVELPLLSQTEREQILHRWNRSYSHRPKISSVAELIRRRVRERPHALAVEAPDGRLSFAQLQLAASGLAERLWDLGATPESLVVVHAHRSAALVVAQLAAWTAGTAFVVVDPKDPPSRRLDVITQVSPVAVLAQIGVDTIPGIRTIPIDLSAISESSLPDRIAAAKLQPENIAYVTFTSGAEGRPKGVCLSHRGLLNLVFWHLETYDLNPADRMALIAAPAFDGSVWEIWPHLVAGVSLCVPDESTRLDPKRLLPWIEQQGITRIFLPTPLAELVLAETPAPSLPLRTLLTGGDRLHRRPSPGLPFELFNHYGPTEATVLSTAARVTPYAYGEAQLLPSIGRPIANVEAYVLDESLEPVPLGVMGELFLAGSGLARGYLNDPIRTALTFLPNPFERHPGQRLYRTGDMVRYRGERSLEFLHRRDHQVQIRGFRVEPSEIEAVLNQHPGVQESTVLALGEDQGRKRLVAFVVLGSLRTDRKFLRALLVHRLPSHMIPSSIEIIEEIPRMSSGKIDRQSLRETYRTVLQTLNPVPPSTQTERILLRLWQRVLQRKDDAESPSGVNENFFHLGGDSLSATRVASEASEIFGREVTSVTLSQYPTVEDLAMFLDGEADQVLAQTAETWSRGGAKLSPITDFPTLSSQRPSKDPAGPPPPEASPPTTPKGRAVRHVNVWLEDEPPVIVGVWHRLGVDIGALREKTLLDQPFTEPRWGDREEIELSLSLAGEDVDIEISPQRAVLRRAGPLEPQIFRIRPQQTGCLDLYLSIFLYRTMALLMRFELSLEVVAPKAES